MLILLSLGTQTAFSGVVSGQVSNAASKNASYWLSRRIAEQARAQGGAVQQPTQQGLMQQATKASQDLQQWFNPWLRGTATQPVGPIQSFTHPDVLAARAQKQTGVPLFQPNLAVPVTGKRQVKRLNPEVTDIKIEKLRRMDADNAAFQAKIDASKEGYSYIPSAALVTQKITEAGARTKAGFNNAKGKAAAAAAGAAATAGGFWHWLSSQQEQEEAQSAAASELAATPSIDQELLTEPSQSTMASEQVSMPTTLTGSATDSAPVVQQPQPTITAGLTAAPTSTSYFTAKNAFIATTIAAAVAGLGYWHSRNKEREHVANVLRGNNFDEVAKVLQDSVDRGIVLDKSFALEIWKQAVKQKNITAQFLAIISIASMMNADEFEKFVSKHSIKMNKEDNVGETVLDRALELKNLELAKKLISAGAKVTSQQEIKLDALKSASSKRWYQWW